MSDDTPTGIPARPAARTAAAVRRDLETALPDDPEAVERAFGNAVRAAWARGEPWAVDWVEQTAFGRTGGV